MSKGFSEDVFERGRVKLVVARLCDRLAVHGARLREARIAAELTGPDFAAMCGWSKQYQRKLETGGQATIGPEAFKKIEDALRSRGVEVEVE